MVRGGQAEKRSFNKCSACRRCKKKCTPVDRDWSRGERCDRCIRKALPCEANCRRSTLASIPQLPPMAPTPNLANSTFAPLEASTPCLSDLHEGGSCGNNVAVPEEVETNVPLHGLGDVAAATCEHPAGGPPDVAHVGFEYASMRFDYLDTLDRCRKLSGMQEKFAQLYQILKRSTYLQDRRTQVSSLRLLLSPLRNREDQHTSELALAFLTSAIHSSQESFANYSGTIIELLEEVDFVDKEKWFWRLEHVFESFTGSLGRSHSRNNPRDVGLPRLAELRRHTLQKLIEISTQSGDRAEVHRLRQELAILSPESARDELDADLREEALSLMKMSAELKELLHSLNYENPYTRNLVATGKSFPSIHIAWLLGQNAVGEFICSNFQCCLEESDVLGRHALHIAAELSNLEFLRFIVSRDPAILDCLLKKRDMWELSPLCVAAYSGNLEFFKELVTAGAKLYETDAQGRDVLFYASSSGKLAIVSFLIEQDRQSSKRALRLDPALYGAASGGHDAVCRILVEKGASVLWKPPQGRSARDEAQAKNHLTTADFLSQAETSEIARLGQTRGNSGIGDVDINPFSRAPRSNSLAPSLPQASADRQLRPAAHSDYPSIPKERPLRMGTPSYRHHLSTAVPDAMGFSPRTSVAASTPRSLTSLPTSWWNSTSVSSTVTAPVSSPTIPSVAVQSPSSDNTWTALREQTSSPLPDESMYFSSTFGMDSQGFDDF